MPYQYDVFISYSSADRPWALKLYDDLTARGISVFLDRHRLDIGKPWEPALARSIQSSQHFIVLWTDNADKSKWVSRELGVFEAIVDPNVSMQNHENRRFIFLMLEGDNPAYTSMQGFSELKEAQAYQQEAQDKGVGAVAPGLWQTVIDKITDAVRDDDPAILVPLAILSMTRQELETISPDKAQDFGPSLNTLLANLGIGTVGDLLANNNYGVNRTDWRPFGSGLNVLQILNSKLDDVNNAIPEPHLRWEQIDAAFWTDLSVARRERDKLLSKQSVIVIDPLSLYYDLVFRRTFVTLSECFKSDKSIIMVLTPFSLPPSIVDLSRMVEMAGDPYFNTYWEPPVPYMNQLSYLGMNIGDERGVRRLLRRGLGSYIRQVQPQHKSEYLKQGQGRG
jgi:hypothetical protein